MADRSEGQERTSPEQIRREIRGTRAEMDQTVNALERKLTPGSLLDELLDRFRGPDGGGLSDVTSGIGTTVRQHPVPLALMGLGLGWLAIERMTGSSVASEARHGRAAGEGWTDEGWTGEGDDRREMDDEDGGTIERMKEGTSSAVKSVREAASSAGETAERVGETGRELGERATEIGRQASRRAREGGRRAQRGVTSFVREQPLAAGAVTFGVGLAAGLAVPSTRWEEETMGETAEAVRGAAGELARETAEEARAVVGEAAHEAREATTQAVRDEPEA